MDHLSGTLCGEIEAVDVPGAEGPVATFFEGEIVDNANHSFYTAAWDARSDADVDISHWSRFKPFGQLAEVRGVRVSVCMCVRVRVGGGGGGRGTGTMMTPRETQPHRQGAASCL